MLRNMYLRNGDSIAVALSMSQTGRRALPFSVCDNFLHVLSLLFCVLSVFLLVYYLYHWEVCLILSDSV